MPDMSLSEAAKWAGVTRPTIFKALKSGKLSGRRDDAGQWRIDASELERVYQPAKASPKPGTSAGNTGLSISDIGPELAAKDREIQLLREVTADLRAERERLHAERDRLLGIVEAAQRQLTHQTQPARQATGLEAQIAAREVPGSVWPRSARVRAWLLARLHRPG